jgi:hypothetical protein
MEVKKDIQLSDQSGDRNEREKESRRTEVYSLENSGMGNENT